MAYTLTLNSISPLTAFNTGNINLVINYTLSGSGTSFPGFSLNLYNRPSGGTLIKTLYSSDAHDPISGDSVSVDFVGVTPGSYYVELYYKVVGTPRREIVITDVVGVKNIKLNGVIITTNKLNATNIQIESLNGVTVYDTRIPLSTPQGGLTDRFDYSEGMEWHGGVMLISIYNSNTESVVLRGRILSTNSDITTSFSHFSLAGGYFFGDSFPPNTGLDYGLAMISQGILTYELLYPITVEVWFEPQSGSSRSASDKLIITINA